MVLLPGLEGTGNLFANFLPEIPPDLKTIVAAYPSQQFLSYSELLPWLCELVPKDGPFVLLAESYGTPLAVKFAAAHPANLAGIILSAGFISNPSTRWGFLPRLLTLPCAYWFAPPDFLLEYFIVGPGASEDLKVAVRNAVRSTSPALIAKRMRAVLNCNAREEIRQVNVPLLYLQAAQDRLVEHECLDEIKRLHPETISISVPAPHLLLQRQPRLAAQAITQFLLDNTVH